MMKVADDYTLSICTYKNFLICKLNKTPKAIVVGIGTNISNFNKNDIHMSKESLDLFNKNLKNITDNNFDNKGLIVYTKNKLFLSTYDNIILNINDAQIYDIPTHTIIENTVDDNIKNELDKIR